MQEAISSLYAPLSKKEKQDLAQEILKAIDNIFTCSSPTLETQALADEIAGESFTRREKQQLIVDSITSGFKRRHLLLQDAVSGEQVRQILNVKSRQTQIDRLKNNTLIGVMDNGVWKFPSWQFDPLGDNGVVNGLKETLQALDISNWGKINWIVTPNPHLQGETPLNRLKQGHVAEVVEEAKGVGKS